MNGSTAKPIILDLATKRVRRGVVGISGDVTFNDDLNKYSAGADIYFRRGGNAIFVRSPFNVLQGPLCAKLNFEYRIFLMGNMAKASDMPVADQGDMCQLIKQRKYTVSNYDAELGAAPKYLQKGVYRVVVWIKDENDVVTTGMHADVVLSWYF